MAIMSFSPRTVRAGAFRSIPKAVTTATYTLNVLRCVK